MPFGIVFIEMWKQGTRIQVKLGLGILPLFEKQRYLVHNTGIAYDTGLSSHFCGIARKHDKTQFAVSAVGSTLNWCKRYIPYYSDVIFFLC